MDGLLIDSEPLWRRAEQAAFARVGIELTDEMCRETMGLRSDEVVALWHQRRPWSGVSREDVRRDMESRVAELVRTEGCMLPGVEQTIEKLQRAGFATALATSSAPWLIEVVLATLGLSEVFRVSCSAVDEERGKPDPAVYLTAVRGLGIPATDCVAFEDSLAGVESARAAGLKVIAVPAPEQYLLSGFDQADLKLRTLEEFEIDLLDTI
jgi:sugar-phosphatase